MIKCPKESILIKTNLKDDDPRLDKEINTLLSFGYNVTLLCWDRNYIYDHKIKKKDNYTEIRLKLKAPTGIKILPLIFLWWLFEIYWLLKLNPEIIHVINFDSVLPAVILSKIKRSVFIYEMHDTYEDHIQMPHIIRNFFITIDKYCMKFAKAVIIVDESRIEELKGIPNKNLSIIYNSPPDMIYSEFRIKNNEEKFNIFYAGALEKHRSLEKIINIVKCLDSVNLIIAGFGSLDGKIKKHAYENEDKIKFIGKINHKEVLTNSLSSDLLFSLYDPIVPLNKFASSNKLFEAMMCGKPILVSKGTAMEDIVRKHNCGIVVDCNDTNEIKNTIICLKKNPEMCKKMGNNGRVAYEEYYSWNIMEKRLLHIYESI